MASTLVVTKPSGVQANDVMVAFVGVRGNPKVTAPAGWTLVQTGDNGNTQSQGTYYHVVGASEPSSYTWSFQKDLAAAGAIVAYSGVDTKNPVAAMSQQVNKDEANTIVAPSVSNPVVGGLLLGLFTMPKDSTVSPPSDLVERAEALSNLGAYKVDVEIADRADIPTGATGAEVATADPSKLGPSIGELIVLRPA